MGLRITSGDGPRQVRAGARNLEGKLLFVVNSAEFFLSHRLPIALAAVSAGLDVAVATPPGFGTDEIMNHGFQYYPIALTRRGIHPRQEVASVWQLWRLFRSVRPDIVHTVTIKPVLYGGIAARAAGIPAVVSAITGLGEVFVARGLGAKIRRYLVTRGYRVALRHPRGFVIFQNPDDRARFVDQRLVAVEHSVLIRGSGVDMELFPVTRAPEGTPVVVLAGRMLWSKGVGEFVAAARNLRAQGLKARFVLVGDTDLGNPQAIPVAVLEGWRREGVVEWWGFRADMVAVLSGAHIVALPSYYGEGVPKVLIEAAALGRALVATDTPGCREIVHHEKGGLLVPIKDTLALAQALGRLASDADARTTFGAYAAHLARAEFSVERVIADTLDLYAGLLGQVY
ncbi:MAG: glycosyltransferase family 4 protein [Acidiferrobacter sp.]